MNDTINTPFFTPEEKLQAAALMEQLRELAGESLRDEDMMRIGTLLTDAIGKGCLQRDSFGHPVLLIISGSLEKKGSESSQSDCIWYVVVRTLMQSIPFTQKEILL